MDFLITRLILNCCFNCEMCIIAVGARGIYKQYR